MKRVLMFAAAVLLLVGGCQSGKKEPTAKEKMTAQWNAARASVMLSLAKDQYSTGNFDKCRQTLDEAMKLEPTAAPLRILSAKVAIEQGQLELADRELAVARESDPKSAEADYLSGVVCQRWQKQEQAYSFYTAASDKAPAELAYLLARAETLVSMDRYAEALAMLQEKVVFFEHSAAIRQATGQLLVQQKQYDEGVKMLRQASILAADDLGIREQLGLALFYAQNYRDAGDVLSRVVANDAYADRPDLLIALGECRLQTGQIREARTTLLRATELSPASPAVWLMLAKASMEVEDYDRAEMSLKKGIALDPSSSQAHLLQGYLRLRQKNFEDALVSFRKASALDGGDTVSLCMIGFVLERQGNANEAMQYYAQALRIRPRDELASRLMATVNVNE